MEMGSTEECEIKCLQMQTNQELMSQIRALQSHNTQLRNIIAKSQDVKPKTCKVARSFDFSKCKFRHVLLKFYYLGWDYQGYVVQEDTANTIEHYLFEALKKTCLIENRQNSNYHRCGRTDKGVSSFSQVISIDLRHDETKDIDYCKILNRVLPETIQIVAWCPVKDDFSARFNCITRTYKYFFPKGTLDIEKMREAASFLIGTHDFRNFCKMDVSNGVVEFTRHILSTSFEKINDESSDREEYEMWVFTIQGKAFLWHQIRCIIGILFLIGQNKEKPDLILHLLDVEKNPRRPDYTLASEFPLNLYHCDYADVNWIYDTNNVTNTIEKLQKIWTNYSIKTTMIKSMLTDLHSELPSSIQINPSGCLIEGVKRKVYTPVMKRQLCDSLEDKLDKNKRKRQDAA